MLINTLNDSNVTIEKRDQGDLQMVAIPTGEEKKSFEFTNMDLGSFETT